MAGISVVGRNYYGVFPLRGTLLNVREASHKQIMENAKITSIKQILGLQHGKQYDSVKTLRYGHLMIMTDQMASPNANCLYVVEASMAHRSSDESLLKIFEGLAFPPLYFYNGGVREFLATIKQHVFIARYLADETAILLLYSLVHGNSNFLEYVLVRTDLDTLLMPMLETLYNASKGTSNQIYMVLIILLVLSQDSSFNASIHKLMLPSVPWYQERLLHQTSLGSLMIIILIRTVNYNLSKLRDIYLHTNCLAILANMAPHVHRLSAYASQRLVSLFDMLSRKYTKLAELKNDKMRIGNGESRGDSLPEEMVVTIIDTFSFITI
ncbi:dymeclin-like [Camellia sinensis]|uniref:dymeclin-like n=1 Tax=Camellia sinensis TaxID=4442 RepID=UPI00103594A9|nr:dymeclin-like [Camellia sinensis]